MDPKPNKFLLHGCLFRMVKQKGRNSNNEGMDKFHTFTQAYKETRTHTRTHTTGQGTCPSATVATVRVGIQSNGHG